MIKLTDRQIYDITQDLDCGMNCFVHKVTGEVKSFPEEMIDEEEWEDVIDEIENDAGNYIEIEKMDSNHSYKVMERFIDTVEDKQLADRLYNAINRSKPFHNFRYELDYSDEYLKKWYAFKSQAMIEWVREQLIPPIEDINDMEDIDDMEDTDDNEDTDDIDVKK